MTQAPNKQKFVKWNMQSGLRLEIENVVKVERGGGGSRLFSYRELWDVAEGLHLFLVERQQPYVSAFHFDAGGVLNLGKGRVFRDKP